MKKEEACRQTWHTVRNICRYQVKTADAYASQVGHFMDFCIDQKPTGTNEQKVVSWLSYCAPRISASTQKQKLSAVLFFFEHVITKPLGDLGPWAHAKRQRIPVWLSHAKIARSSRRIAGS